MTCLVINPNSSVEVTNRISEAVAHLENAATPITCVTLHDGPPGIETDDHVADAARRVTAYLDDGPAPSSIVVACFSDPGVAALKAKMNIPVVGIREASVRAALQVGARFGVIAIGAASVPRHIAAFEDMGVLASMAGDQPLGLSVPELLDEDRTMVRMIEVAQVLRDKDGADVLILGCAGMPTYRSALESEISLPVIEPCAAAVAEVLAQG